MKERGREKRKKERKRGRNEMKKEMQIHRVVQRFCALAHHIKNYTGTVPSWWTVSREQEQSNIFLNIRLTPGGNLCKM